MKVKVKDLEANPFRKIKHYPINREKLNSLKTSIKETTFWDNILARKYNGKFQIAYGHHRLLALKELDIQEVDIPVRDLDDATMIRIMANENMEAWGLSPAIINETVLTAKEFLDTELAKYETLKQAKRVPTNGNPLSTLFNDEGNFQQCKKNGTGEQIILKFLGGNWKKWMIGEALSILHSAPDQVDREAVEMMPTMKKATEFRKAVTDYKIPKTRQKQIAQKLVKDDVSSKHIRDWVDRERPKRQIPAKDREFEELKKTLEDIDKEARTLDNRISGVLAKTRTMNVIHLRGLQPWFTASSLCRLMESIFKLYDLFGVKKRKQLGGKTE